MKYQKNLQLIGISSCLALVKSFSFVRAPPGLHAYASSKKIASSDSRHWKIRAASASALASTDNSPEEKPELVAQNTFIAATETLYREAAKAQGVEYVNQEDPNNPFAYAIGKLNVNLSIPPGIDLVETPELVLVNGVSVSAQEQGIKPLDTIVGVSAVNGTFQSKTMALNLDETFTIMKEAIAHARNNGEDVIELELNRLIKGYYKN